MRPVPRKDSPVGSSERPCRWPGVMVLSLILIGVLACSDGGVGPGDDEPKADVAEYLATLPTWDVFSPRLEDRAPEPVGDPVELPPVTLDVPIVDEHGDTATLSDQVYLCTETPYSMTQNPREIVMYSPNVGVLWAGGLLQGKSHRAGNLESLPIRQRQPVKVSIPGIASGQNYRVVENPELATVNAAIMDMVGNATLAGTPSASSIDFEYTESYSEQQLALAMGLSGRYMGFRAKAKASFEHNASETTITAHFVEKMYDVVVELPQTPADFFSADFTQAELDRQTALGRMGPDNLPVFIHTITYGRMMTFTMTSTASATEIRATLEAAYKDIGRSAELNLSVKHKAILDNSRISVTSYGGNAQATLEVIRTGDLSRYFTAAAPLSSAAPLSYVFQTLDGKPAGVTEATNYNVRDCQLQLPTDGIFNLAPVQTVPLGLSTTGLRTRMADVNGDGRTDIIWNSLSSGGNSWVVGLANEDGTFTMTAPVTHPVANPEAGWQSYDTVVGDFDGDGLIDMAWATRGSEGNHIYLATSDGDGTFTVEDVVSGEGGGAAHTAWRVYAGDSNGDGRDDLFFNYLHYPKNYTVIATSEFGDSTGFTLGPYQENPVDGHWENYETFVGDVNGDGRADLFWSHGPGGVVTVFLGVSGTTPRTLSFRGGYVQRNYGVRPDVFPLVGDVNGDGMTDAIVAWAEPDGVGSGGSNPVLVGLGTTASSIGFLPIQTARNANSLAMDVRVGDLNGDGRTDLLWNELGGDNKLYVSLGKADGTFDFSTKTQVHTEVRSDWTQYTPYLADVSGDGRQDVIWIHAGVQTRIYVGLSER